MSPTGGSSPRSYKNKAGAQFGTALWRPVAASVFVYSTVLAFVIELWRQRTEIDQTAAVVFTNVQEAVTEVIPGAPIEMPQVSEPQPDAVEKHSQSSQNSRPISLSSDLLRAAWQWAQSSTSGIVGDQRLQDVSGLQSKTLRVHSIDLGQREPFEFVLLDGSRIKGGDCQLEARSPLNTPLNNIIVSASGEALTLKCPRDLHVHWSAALLRLASGAEVLRVRMSFDSSPMANGKTAAAEVQRLVMWSLNVPECEQRVPNVTSSSQQGSVCFASAAKTFSASAKGTHSRADTVLSVAEDGSISADTVPAGAAASTTGSPDHSSPTNEKRDQSAGHFSQVVDGSPLVSSRAGAWLALEHPRSNYVSPTPGVLEMSLESPAPKTSYVASLGVVGQPARVAPESAAAAEDEEDALLLVRRHFHSYLEVVRASPYRPQLHYSTWYDLRRSPCVDSSPLGYPSCSAAHPLNRVRVEARLQEFHQQLKVLRGVHLDGMMLDDGWDASAEAPWEAEPRNFPNGGLAAINAQAAQLGVALGVWMSPWGGYGEGGKRRLRYATSVKGALDSHAVVRLSSERYHTWFRNLTRELALKAGLRFFKFDGFAAGLGATGAQGPMAADVDALMHLATELRQDIQTDTAQKFWVTASTGVWPSPFWLKVADVVWRDGPDLGREGAGSPRQQWITFRDAMVYRRVVLRAPLFPLSSLALGGIIWSKAEEPGSYLNSFEMEDFRVEVRSYFLTGAALQDLHVQPELLTASHWDIIADAANVSRQQSLVLKDSHWIGGDPGMGEAYGYAGFACPPCAGLLTWRNPKATRQNVSFTLRQALALPKDWPGGSRDGLWNIRQLWRPDTAVAKDGWDKVELAERLTLSLAGLEFLAFQALPAGLLR